MADPSWITRGPVLTQEGATRLQHMRESEANPREKAQYIAHDLSFQGVPRSFDLISAIEQALEQDPDMTPSGLNQHIVSEMKKKNPPASDYEAAGNAPF